jgi:hypothetical protein
MHAAHSMVAPKKTAGPRPNHRDVGRSMDAHYLARAPEEQSEALALAGVDRMRDGRGMLRTGIRMSAALSAALAAVVPGGTVSAQPAPAAPSGAGCFPPCREGFVCNAAQCVSWCNPPCPSDQVCFEGRRCDYPLPKVPGRAIYEPPVPLAKPFESRSFFMLGFHYGFPGSFEQSGLAAPLDSTIGFNLRGDAPIERYLLLGPLIQFGAWRPDVTPTAGHNYYIDVNFYLRGRIPITTPQANFQFWGGVPIGFTFDILGQGIPGVSDMGIGWTIGVLFGGAVHFTPNFGLFTEAGWIQHKISHGQNVDFRLAQWELNLGFVFRD